MLVAAALVPPTALLVPGASGIGDVLAAERRAALAAVRTVIAERPDALALVVPGAGPVRVGRMRPTLAAAGVDDAALGWPPQPTAGAGRVLVVDDVPAAVGLLLLHRAGWRGAVDLVPAGPTDGATLRMTGDRMVRLRRWGLVLVGGLSARHGPDGPLATDDRAAPLDDVLAADLADLDGPARARLRAVPSRLATTLAISAWGPWQVLLGAVPGDPARSRTHRVSAPLGAGYAALSWQW